MELGGVGSRVEGPVSRTSEISQVQVVEKNINKENKDVREEAEKLDRERLSEDEIINVIKRANSQIATYNRRFEYSIHEKTKQVMIKVLDSITDEVIKELPPEKIQDIVGGLWEVAGLIIDKKI